MKSPIFASQLPSWRRHAENLPHEIDELLAGRKRIIWDSGEDITREVTATVSLTAHPATG